MTRPCGALDGKVIVVSGVGPGLGRAVASEALRAELASCSVISTELRVRAILSDLGAEENALAVEADISSLPACEELVSVARSAFGRLDGLVHVVALDTPVGGLLDGDLDDWSAVADVNVKGTLQLTKLAVPLLHDSGAGSVVMVGSIAAAGPVEGVVQLRLRDEQGFGACRRLATTVRVSSSPLGILVGYTVARVGSGD